MTRNEWKTLHRRLRTAARNRHGVACVFFQHNGIGYRAGIGPGYRLVPGGLNIQPERLLDWSVRRKWHYEAEWMRCDRADALGPHARPINLKCYANMIDYLREIRTILPYVRLAA